MKTAEEIFNKHSWEAIGAISPSKDFCLKAMQEYAQQIASLAWDAGYERSEDEWPSTKKAIKPTKEQFLNSIFNNQQETK